MISGDFNMVLFEFHRHRWLAASTLGMLLASTAYAQSTASAPPNGASTVGTKPAFESYKAFTDVAVGDWKAANDTVAKIGGWREYARQAQQPDGKAAAPPTAGRALPNPEAKP
jgi:hypothetical protein